MKRRAVVYGVTAVLKRDLAEKDTVIFCCLADLFHGTGEAGNSWIEVFHVIGHALARIPVRINGDEDRLKTFRLMAQALEEVAHIDKSCRANVRAAREAEE